MNASVKRRARASSRAASEVTVSRLLNGIEIADGDRQRAVLEVVAEEDVLKVDRALREVELGLVAEAARHGAFGAEHDAAGAGVEAEVAGS